MIEEPPKDPAALACLSKTRSVVLNLLLGSGMLMAVGGIVLGRMDRGATLWPERQASRIALGILFALIFGSYGLRRILASREALRPPRTRGARFFRAHVISAALGELAALLGLFYGYAVRPRLDAVVPFWVAAMALQFLALPRGYELDDFDEPMPPIVEPEA